MKWSLSPRFAQALEFQANDWGCSGGAEPDGTKEEAGSKDVGALQVEALWMSTWGGVEKAVQEHAGTTPAFKH